MHIRSLAVALLATAALAAVPMSAQAADIAIDLTAVGNSQDLGPVNQASLSAAIAVGAVSNSNFDSESLNAAQVSSFDITKVTEGDWIAGSLTVVGNSQVTSNAVQAATSVAGSGGVSGSNVSSAATNVLQAGTVTMDIKTK